MAEPFITEAELGDYLDRDLTGDAAATLAVEGACAACRTIAEQTFSLVTDDEITLDGTGTDALALPELPVVEVTAVTENDETVDAADYIVTSGGLLIKPARYARWATGRQNIVVTYTHGYEPEDFPADVRLVALSIAGRLLDQGNVRQEALGAYSVTYAGAATDMTAGERSILRKHRRT